MNARTFALNQQLTNFLIFAMLKWYLLVDMLNGFFTLGLGVDIKLSALYKAAILCLILLVWFSTHVYNLLGLCAIILTLLFSETIHVFSGAASGEQFGFLFQHIIKLITPFITFLYLSNLLKNTPAYYDEVKKIIHFNLAIFIINMCLGLAGFGFSTYGGSAEEGIGIKGFFYAGNETSMVWIVLSAYLLNRVYERGYRVGYMLASTFVLFIGLMISTKTSILATLLVILLTPIIIERSNLINFRKPVAYLFFTFILILCFAVYQILELFLDSLFVDRIRFFYGKRGFIGIILSGRELFFLDLYNILAENDDWFSFVFGKGASFYSDHTLYFFIEKVKISAELDLPDIFFWHGLIGVFIVLFFFTKLNGHAFKKAFDPTNSIPKTILLTNFLLLVIANITGHVFTSGMLGFLWAAFNSLAFYSKRPCHSKLY